jgi:hypothetical protein
VALAMFDPIALRIIDILRERDTGRGVVVREFVKRPYFAYPAYRIVLEGVFAVANG